MPGLNTANPNLPFFSLTEYGRKVVASDDPVPHDPDQYLSHVEEVAPRLDRAALRYLAEGLECFQRGTYTASVVMLGVASEKLTLDFAGTVQRALPQKESDSLKRVIERDKIAKVFDETMKKLAPRIPRLPFELRDGLEAQVEGMFATIRTHRNQAGHPTGEMIDRLTALGLFSSFPFYCKKVSELITFIDQHGLP